MARLAGVTVVGGGGPRSILGGAHLAGEGVSGVRGITVGTAKRTAARVPFRVPGGTMGTPRHQRQITWRHVGLGGTITRTSMSGLLLQERAARLARMLRGLFSGNAEIDGCISDTLHLPWN